MSVECIRDSLNPNNHHPPYICLLSLLNVDFKHEISVDV